MCKSYNRLGDSMKIKDTEIHYLQYGLETGKDIVLLHGWNQNIEMMDPIGEHLKKDFRITLIDLPGFGKSPEPPTGWIMTDYYEVVVELLKKLKIKKPIMIGHSFGGRIAIMYAAEQPTYKLVLFGAPFRPQNNKKISYKVKIYKMLKKVPILKNYEDYFKSKIGSRDYRNATPEMRRILVNVINTDLTNYLSQIKCPTLLIWGSEDNEVLVTEAKYLETAIDNCGLVVYEGCGHYAYLERIKQTINVLNEFFKNDKEV